MITVIVNISCSDTGKVLDEPDSSLRVKYQYVPAVDILPSEPTTCLTKPVRYPIPWLWNSGGSELLFYSESDESIITGLHRLPLDHNVSPQPIISDLSDSLRLGVFTGKYMNPDTPLLFWDNEPATYFWRTASSGNRIYSENPFQDRLFITVDGKGVGYYSFDSRQQFVTFTTTDWYGEWSIIKSMIHVKYDDSDSGVKLPLPQNIMSSRRLGELHYPVWSPTQQKYAISFNYGRSVTYDDGFAPTGIEIKWEKQYDDAPQNAPDWSHPFELGQSISWNHGVWDHPIGVGSPEYPYEHKCIDGLDWSYNGSFLALILTMSTDTPDLSAFQQLRIFDAQGETQTVFSLNPLNEGAILWPQWSPVSASELLFTHHQFEDNSTRVCIVNFEETIRVDCIPTKTNDVSGLWSPDGSMIAILSVQDSVNQMQVDVLDIETFTRTPLYALDSTQTAP